MEILPDELLLTIFQYLHQFETLYSFSDLNARFQRIIEPYYLEIDLTENNTAYKHALLFVTHILPYHTPLIRTLKFNSANLLQSVSKHISHLVNLKSLAVQFDATCTPEEHDQFITVALALPSLVEFSIFPSRKHRLFECVSSFASPNLTTLTLTTPTGYHYLRDLHPMPTIKRLSINLSSSRMLAPLFDAMTNLEELRLSIVSCIQSQYFHRIKIPPVFRKLHFEFGHDEATANQLDLNIIQKFLNIFRDNLTSLTLMGILSRESFSSDCNSLRTLVSNFTHLENFQYFLRRTSRQMLSLTKGKQVSDSDYLICTEPRPYFFDRTVPRATLHLTLQTDSSSMLSQLSDCATKLSIRDYALLKTLSDALELNSCARFTWLKEITFNHDPDKQVMRDICRLMRRSPKLDTIILDRYQEHVAQALLLLPEYIPKAYLNRIRHCQFELSQNYYSLMYELSKVFPELTTLRLPRNGTYLEKHFITLTEFIQMVKDLFPLLRRLTFFALRKDPNRRDFENRAKELNVLQQKNHPWHCTAGNEHQTPFCYLSVWF